MDLIALVGRLMFAAMFIMSGVNHLTKRTFMSEYARAMNVPAAMATVVVSGVMILVGGAMVAVGAWGDLGALLLAMFLVPTAIAMHGFWRLDDAQARTEQQMHFMKNMTLAGGALGLMALFMCAGDGLMYALTGPLFGS